MFSPHTRGCSSRAIFLPIFSPVFPAYAGMFRSWRGAGCPCGSFPRIRGDVPMRLLPHRRAPVFSPHTRGCSEPRRVRLPDGPVFPAYAGMFLDGQKDRKTERSFPRIRGDVPSSPRPTIWKISFSPHTRGCSLAALWFINPEDVFPAYAGMFRIMQNQYGA